jgi:hypothetical protein
MTPKSKTIAVLGALLFTVSAPAVAQTTDPATGAPTEENDGDEGRWGLLGLLGLAGLLGMKRRDDDRRNTGTTNR